MDDINTLAENKLDAMELEDQQNANNGNEEDVNKGKGEENELPEGDEAKGENGEEESQDESEDENKDGEQQEEDGDGSGDEEEQEEKELSDDDLIKLAKERGLDLAKKEDDKPKDEPKPEVKRPKELDEDTWGEMNEVQRTIYSELPYITVAGKDSEGNAVNLRIKTPEQLPEDFEFVNKRAEASFISDVTAQSKRAEEAYAKLSGMSEQQKQAQAQQEESQKVVADVERLQKDKILPKIVAKPGTPEFDNDPSVKLVNEILNYWDNMRKNGEAVSVYTAGKLFRSENPDKFKDTTKSKGDDERKNVSGKVKGGGRGVKTDNKEERPKFAPGTSASDIADYYASDLD